jgi:hypothetical protein
VDVPFPQVEKIRVVLDNLNTHSPVSLYEAFLPDQATLTRELAVYTLRRNDASSVAFILA